MSVDEIQKAIKELAEERDMLRSKLMAVKVKRVDGKRSQLAIILRMALENETGWRDLARDALGDYEYLACYLCGNPFKTGGRLKKHCRKCVERLKA